MSENIMFAAGYPIGFAEIKGNEYYTVQLNDVAYPVNLLTAYIWLEALNGVGTKVEIMDNVLKVLQSQGYEIGVNFALNDLETGYDSLLSSSLLMELDVENIELMMEKYPQIVPYRNGFGLGVDSEKITIHYEDEDVEVSAIEYYIWQLSNGSRTLMSMYAEYENAYRIARMQNLQEINEEYVSSGLKISFIEAFVSLYRKNLVYISGI